jgi:uncharacterized membrane protein YdcZ (DUF606 family)
MSVLAAAHRGVAGYPVLAFMLINLGVGFVTATIPPIADSKIPPFGQPLHGVVGGALGVALAFLSRPGCRAALVSQTSDVAVCAGGSRCAGT